MKASLLFGALALLSLPAGKPIELVARHAQGDVFEEKDSFWSSSSEAAREAEGSKPAYGWNVVASGAGSGDGEFLSASESTTLDEVLAVKDGKRVRVKRTFVVSSTTAVDTSHGDASPRRTRAAFEGQTAILVAEAEGVRIEGELEGAEELDESDLCLTSRWERLLPATPIEVGESWALSEDAARSLLRGMALTKAEVRCTLDGVDASAEGKPARIKLDFWATASVGLEGTCACEIRASGLALWSTAAGHLMEATLSGERKTTLPDGAEETGTFGLLHEVRRIE